MRDLNFSLRTGISVVFLLGCLGGCSQPLRTLMDLSNEQKSQQDYVARERARFKVLLRDAREDRLKAGLAFSDVISRYGTPVLGKDGSFLYRDPVDFFNSPKVYMVFDESDRLTQIRIETRDGK